MVKSVNKRYHKSLLSVLYILISLPLLAQFKVEGKVLDAETQRPVQSFRLTTGSEEYIFKDGTFLIEQPSLTEETRLIVNAEGYLPVSIPLTKDSPGVLTIQLIPQNINIQEIVVKAFGSEKRLMDTPGSIGIITNRQLVREPSFTLAPSVNKFPGVWMQSGSMNTNRLTIRGIGTRSAYGSNKIRAYYGDIPLTNGVGETTLEDLELEQMSDIEIIKGPASGFYGSGLGGVLLFNPAKATRTQFSQSVSIGSFNTIKYSGKADIATRNGSHSVIYSRFHSDGYRDNNEMDRHNVTLASSMTKKQITVNLLGAFIQSDAYIPSSIDFNTFMNTPQRAAANWAAARGYEDYRRAFGGLTLQQGFNDNLLAKVSLFGQINTNNELRPFNILQEQNNYVGARAIAEKKFTTANYVLKIIAGDEFFTENYDWQTLENEERVAGAILSDNHERRWYNNLFLLADLNLLEKMIVSASVNLNQTSYRYEDQFLENGDQGGEHKFPVILSPRLAASWIMNKDLRIFSVVSHGFSPPTLEETLLPGGLRNTSIQPETGWNYELGTKGQLGQSLSFELSAYYMKVKNLLVAQRTGEDEYMGINAGGTNHPGIEARVDYRLINRPDWSSYLRVNATATRYRFAEFTDRGNDYAGNKLTGTPDLQTNWMLETSHKKGFFLNLHYLTVGRMPMRDDNSIYSKAYELTNVMAGYEKTFRNLSIGLSSGIQNLLDEHYASMILINATAPGTQSPRYYYPGLPRNYKAQVSLRYSF
ncbi:MAG: TonB-dependent receptor plug domain-containing protein [Verrucomicrobia bacterium]|nr:TonB-dependent receptor plug domain-containing protein [Prolixibacteraceae bacterium]